MVIPIIASEVVPQRHELLMDSGCFEPVVDSNIRVVSGCIAFEVELSDARLPIYVSSCRPDGPFFATLGARPRLSACDMRVRLLTMSRCPLALDAILMQGSHLQHCRQAMRVSGVEPKLAGGAKLFVRPESAAYVMNAIRYSSQVLKPHHIICSPEYELLVEQAIQCLPRGRHGEHVKVRTRSDLETCRQAESSSSGRVVVISRTFLELQRESPSHPSPCASTTDAHLGPCRNPRRASASRL